LCNEEGCLVFCCYWQSYKIC